MKRVAIKRSEFKRTRLVRRRRAVLKPFKSRGDAEKNSAIPSVEKLAAVKHGRKRMGAGPRMKEWARVWAWLKPRLEAAGRIYCEFPFIDHECCEILDPAHSRKQRLMQGDDIYVVSIACRNAHRILDEVYTHEEMETAVWRAINEHGGVIIPAKKAA